MKWKVFFQTVFLIIFIAIIVFTVKRNSDVGRYVVKNAKLNLTYFSTPKMDTDKTEELIKIDTVTGRVWKYHKGCYYLEEDNVIVDKWTTDTWIVIGEEKIK